MRGRWGEITLRRLVELAGMVEHCDFQEQVHTAGEGQAIRPDMIVRMPDRRELVVDVKTPLDAYLEAVEAENDAQRKLGLERSVLPGARKFVELGIHQKKAIEKLDTLDPVPRTMIESATEESDDEAAPGDSPEKTLQ